jgi:Amt family ammonium transporter
MLVEGSRNIKFGKVVSTLQKFFFLPGGGMSFAAAIMLGPRLGRYANGLDPLPMGNPVNACMGLFVLWWGWLAFNAGSTYGLSNSRHIYSARAAVMTMLASFGGGCFSLVFSLFKNSGRLDILDVINSILSALVGITGISLHIALQLFKMIVLEALF